MSALNPKAPDFIPHVVSGYHPDGCWREDNPTNLQTPTTTSHDLEESKCETNPAQTQAYEPSERLVRSQTDGTDLTQEALRMIPEGDVDTPAFKAKRTIRRTMSEPALSVIPEEEELDLSYLHERMKQAVADNQAHASNFGPVRNDFTDHPPMLAPETNPPPPQGPGPIYYDPTFDYPPPVPLFVPQYGSPQPVEFGAPFDPQYHYDPTFDYPPPPQGPGDIYYNLTFNYPPPPQEPGHHYYDPKFDYPPPEPPFIPNHEPVQLGTPFNPHYNYDYPYYNANLAHNRYPFPVQGPAQMILDYSMLGRPQPPVPMQPGEGLMPSDVEYCGYVIGEAPSQYPEDNSESS